MISRRKPSLLGPAMAWFYPAWVCLACTLIFAQRKGQLFTGSRSMLAAGLLMLALGSLLALKNWMRKPRSKMEWLLLGILCAAFVIRLYNVLYTPVNVRQHDVAPFGQTEPIRQFYSYGHAEYIEWICRYLRLPEVSPLNYQLYHPPLHHFIAGLWLRLNLTAGMAYRRACESIQFLTLYYSFGTVLAGKRLFEQLGLKKADLLPQQRCWPFTRP